VVLVLIKKSPTTFRHHVPQASLRPATAIVSVATRSFLNLSFATYTFIAATGAFTAFGLVGPAFGVLYVWSALLFFLSVLERQWPVKATLLTVPVLLFSMLALLSVLWSAEPEATLRFGFQLLATCVFGLYIGSTLGLRGTLLALTLAAWACLLISLVNVPLGVVPSWSVDDYVGAPRFFSGIYDQKNGFGYVIVLCAFTALIAGLQRGVAGSIAAVTVVLALSPLLLASGSSTALILYAMVLAFLPFFATFYFTRSMLLTLALGLTLLSGALFVIALAGNSPIELLLARLGKDATLTGRTAIWSVAAEQFKQSPWFGTGYQVFWSAPEFSSAVDTIRARVLDEITNFHNAIIECVVGLGIVGVAVLCTTIVLVALSALSRIHSIMTNIARFDSLVINVAGFWLIMLLCVRSFVEATLYFQHQIDFLLLAALAAAFSQLPSKGDAAC